METRTQFGTTNKTTLTAWFSQNPTRSQILYCSLLYICNNKQEVSKVAIMVRFSYKNVNRKSVRISRISRILRATVTYILLVYIVIFRNHSNKTLHTIFQFLNFQGNGFVKNVVVLISDSVCAMLNEILRRLQIKNWGGCAINSRPPYKSKTVAVCLKTVVGYLEGVIIHSHRWSYIEKPSTIRKMVFICFLKTHRLRKTFFVSVLKWSLAIRKSHRLFKRKSSDWKSWPCVRKRSSSV